MADTHVASFMLHTGFVTLKRHYTAHLTEISPQEKKKIKIGGGFTTNGSGSTPWQLHAAHKALLRLLWPAAAEHKTTRVLQHRNVYKRHFTAHLAQARCALAASHCAQSAASSAQACSSRSTKKEARRVCNIGNICNIARHYAAHLADNRLGSFTLHTERCSGLHPPDATTHRMLRPTMLQTQHGTNARSALLQAENYTTVSCQLLADLGLSSNAGLDAHLSKQ
jgi:uncharacterized protein YciW